MNTDDETILRFSISGRISKPVHEVYEAVADPAVLSEYFTTGGARGRIEPGAVVTWDFADFPGAFPVEVIDAVPDERIVLRWDAPDTGDGALRTTVTMTFAALEDGRTLVTIAEEGWHDTDGGRTASYGNCEGWTGMLCAMKAWLEHSVNLRAGYYA
ncbi:SRPBCC family protein [Microbacterium deminutum]|uniref:SRPBCC domain-containing protein n=1 Tax=Microbacterium deminutum TaxID=344164 RepID=A0ABP5C9S5_9MICO